MRSMFKFTTIIIIGLVFLILIIGYIRYINTQMNEAAKIKQCQGSIEAYMGIRTLSAKLEAPDINCPTEYTTVTSKDKEVIKKEVVDKIARCWKMWKKGDYVFLDKIAPEDASQMSTTYCHICEVSDFKNKGIIITEEDMRTYFNNNKIDGKSIISTLNPVYDPPIGELTENHPAPKLTVQAWQDTLIQQVDTSSTYAIAYNEVVTFKKTKYNLFSAHMSYPMLVKYDAEGLKYCSMTIAEQKT